MTKKPVDEQVKERKEKIAELLKQGEDQGFVTQDQIMEMFVYPELYLEELDDTVRPAVGSGD